MARPMPGLLLSQLDYLHFTAGLGMVLLGCVALALVRAGPLPTPWWLVAVFAFGDGAARWAQLVAWTAGDSPTLQVARAALAWGACAALLEFARRTHRLLRWTDVGSWIHVALGAAVVGALAASGVRILATEARLFVGVPACAWTSWLFLRAAERTEEIGGGEEGRRARQAGALGFALLAVTMVLGPALALLPPAGAGASWQLAARRLPAPIAEAAVALFLALALWSLSMAHLAAGTTLRKRRVLFWATAGSVGTLLVAGWVTTEGLGRLHQREAMAETASAAARIRDRLDMEMAEADAGARTLSRLVARLGIAAGGRLDRHGLDGLADTLAAEHDDLTAYVLDAQGTTVSSSNRHQPASFIGQSFAHRPYYRQAVAGGHGVHIGVGQSTGVPGYYASEPIREAGGSLVAVVVVKHDLGAHPFGPAGLEQAYLAGPDGRILARNGAGSRDGWLWRSPGEGAPAGGAGAAEAAILPGPPPEGTSWTTDAATGVRRLAVRQPLAVPGWSLVVLRDDGLTVGYRLLGLLVTLLLGVPVLVGFVALQRQMVTEDHLAFEKAEAEVRAEALARQADTDPLTGLKNRLGLNAAISREVARSRRHQQPLSVMFLDLDHFKAVNDTHGHPAGDQVLVGVARLLEAHVRGSDVVARWGGEEFVIVAPMTQAEGAARLGEKLRSLIAATPMGPAGAVTASIGVAELLAGETIERLLHRADEALYRAKSGGRNRVECAAEAADPAAVPAGAGSAARAERSLYPDTSYAPLDAEHRALGDRLQGLVRAVEAGRTAIVLPAMETFLREARDHFGHEDALMERLRYPQREEHQRAHRLFLEDARRLGADVEAAGVTDEVRRWASGRLVEWFRFHALLHDQSLARFLFDAGAAGAAATPGPVVPSGAVM